MYNRFKKTNCSWLRVFLVLLSLILSSSANAQQMKIQGQNLASLKVDELNDDQIKNFYVQFLNSGYTQQDIEYELQKRKMPEAEIAKFKVRLEEILAKDKSLGSNQNAIKEDNADNNSRVNRSLDEGNPFEILIPKIFGSELFNNPKLSFEPNLKMATPVNYQLGPDDELLIDIFGYSEQSYRLVVSPEGQVRIPNLGPVLVAGLTVEQAQIKIRNKLISVYPRIGSGQTSVSVNLGSIRSIKVIILGEVTLPGTYSLPSLATVFNALYASGGPNLNGSFRNIKLVRGNKVIAKIDMYDFLLNGNSKGNIPLKDQDVIKVEPYENRVEVKGFTKREGFFEMKDKETLSQLLNFAGGFSPVAYTERIKVVRNTGSQKSISDIDKAMYVSFQPKNGDVFTIDSVLSRFENRIAIEGAVFRPGYFSLESNKTLSSLIKNADGLKEDAFMTRATVLRKKDDNSMEVISVDLLEIIKGTKDLELKREDKITIVSKLEMRENYTITINGPVMKPGIYPYAENMRVEDLIILAGGLKESASLENIQISERSYNVDRKNPQTELSKITTISIQKDLKGESEVLLKPFDVVTIFPQPSYQKQKQVVVNGQVMFPGTYVLAKGNERISDVIKRAGGLTARGFPEGAILIRPKSNTFQDLVVKENKLEALRKLSKDTTKLSEEIEKEMERTTDIVGINLDKILKNPGSKGDLFLMENDILEIPIIKQTVLVSGQVLYPVRLRYDKRASLKTYVSQAGGFSSQALKKRSYVVYANGTANDTKSFLFFKFYPKIKPGSEIVIPIKDEKKNLSTVEVISIATSLTSMLVILSTLLK
ncbi:MAG: SLBB domain-containing protein [Bacteroidia bacterium]|nr:SLBB domain-containing protein [Bacteroidia bacterium]MCF8445530.1 SLBB domain-containing protein [Bacteroidia bacterium]